jgi:phage baseplate assembly protein V
MLPCMSEDLARRLANLIRFGTVDSVTTSPARVVCKVGGLLTRPVRWVSVRAGSKTRSWSPPSPGEQVLLLAPNGDTTGAVALTGLFSDANPPPEGANDDNVIIAFGDGAVLLYDLAKHLLSGMLPAGGRVEVAAPGGFLFTGDTAIDGNLSVTKNVDIDGTAHAKDTITSDTDVVGGGISLKNHTHPGVQAGGAKTGAPQ